MLIQGKIWGETSPLIITPLVEVHKVTANPGFHCSKHCHARKWNAFAVIEGSLTIKVWKNDYDLVDETVLFPGDVTTVRPGEYHQFEVPADEAEACSFFEIYYLEGLGPDIIRIDHGGAQPSEEPEPLA